MVETIPADGLSVIWEPANSLLDIVFIHGFNGHPTKTWTHSSATCRPVGDEEPATKAQKCKESDSPATQSTVPVFWPRHLLPKITPNARILSYGYDLRIGKPFSRRPSSTCTISEIARDFLVALEAARRSKPSQDLLFVAHSLGGIVVNEMLFQASRYEREPGQAGMHEVYTSTIGIFYFGTPHRGTDPLGSLGGIMEKLSTLMGLNLNKGILRVLNAKAEFLLGLVSDIAKLATHQRWTIYTFQEVQGVAILGGSKVVEDASSLLGLPKGEKVVKIARDHMAMCRFAGEADPEFVEVRRAFQHVIETKNAPRDVPRSTEENHILSALDLESKETKLLTLRSAHEKTCQWILGDQKYVDWLDAKKIDKDHGVLWIKGKPGAGKSTLMKFCFHHAQKEMKGTIVVSYFFNAGGNEIERTMAGMYRSILYQLLSSPLLLPWNDDILQVFAECGALPRLGNNQTNWTKRERLEEIFEKVTPSFAQTPVVCFIDALDECVDEDEILLIVRLLGKIDDISIKHGHFFKICLASRHFPRVTIGRGEEINLDRHQGHVNDINSYIDDELRVGDMHNPRAQAIQQSIKDRAEGVFMWVVLVVGLLNKEYGRTSNIQALTEVLEKLPDRLTHLIKDILTRDQRDMEQLLRCVQWILFSTRMLTPEELYHALRFRRSSIEVSGMKADEMSSDAYDHSIVDLSKGLTEVVQPKNLPTRVVQFIHESVRDFFLKEDGLASLWGETLGSIKGPGMKGIGHDYLKQTCADYIDSDLEKAEIDTTKQCPTGAQYRKTAKQARLWFPFLGYAAQNVLHHADQAQGSGIDQTSFLHEFSKKRRRWIWILGFLEREQHQQPRTPPKCRLISIAAEKDLVHLIEPLGKDRAYLRYDKQRKAFPIIAAIAAGSHESVLKIMELEALYRPRHSGATSRFVNLYKDRKGKHPPFQENAKGTSSRKRDSKQSMLDHLPTYDSLLTAFILTTSITNCKKPQAWQVLRDLEWARPQEHAEALLASGLLQEATADDALQKVLVPALAFDCKNLIKRLLSGKKIRRSWITATKSDDDIPEHDDLIGLQLLRDTCRAAWKQMTDTKQALLKAFLDQDLDAIYDGVLPRYLQPIDLEPSMEDLQVGARGPSPNAAPYKWYNDLLQDLLDNAPIDRNLKGRHHCPILSHVSHVGCSAALTTLLDQWRVDPNARDGRGRTALHHAAERGHAEIARQLCLRRDVAVDAKDNSGTTALHEACCYGHADIVEEILKVDESLVNIQDDNGHTPLHVAVLCGDNAMVEVLLGCRLVDVTLITVNGETPLQMAIEHGSDEIVELLQASVNIGRSQH